MRLAAMVIVAIVLLMTACGDSVQPAQRAQNGDRVLHRITAQGDTVALHVTIRGGEVARVRHVQNGRLLLERSTERGKRQFMLHRATGSLRTELSARDRTR